MKHIKYYFLILLIPTFVGGVVYGIKYESSKFEAKTKSFLEREARILEWVVKKNPNATIKNFNKFPKALLTEAEKINVDYRVLLAMITKESRLDPYAVGVNGEIGLGQILPETAKLIAEKLKDTTYEPPNILKNGRYSSLGSLGDPIFNLHYTATYLGWQLDEFKTIPISLRAYNRNPKRAKDYRPNDRYAEDIAFITIALLQHMDIENR